MDEKQDHLEDELRRLKETTKRLIETRGYTKEVEKLKILEEMIREQIVNENFVHSTRTAG